MVSFVWFCISTGALVAAISGGILLQIASYKELFGVVVVLVALSLIPFKLDYLPKDNVSFRSNAEKSMSPAFMLAIGQGTSGCVYAILALMGYTTALLCYATVSAIVIGTAQFLCLESVIAKCNVFIFLQEVLYISISGALDRFYTAPQGCVPGGPSFTYSYYQSYTTVLGLLATWVALWLYQKWCRHWPARRTYYITTLLRCFGALFDWVVAKRVNAAYGVPDKVVFVLGDSIILPIVTALNCLPIAILMAGLCPKDLESTIYAILAGYQSSGMMLSKILGIHFTHYFGISASQCVYDYLPNLILFCHSICPILILPLAYYLLPSDMHFVKSGVEYLAPDETLAPWEDVPLVAALQENAEPADLSTRRTSELQTF